MLGFRDSVMRRRYEATGGRDNRPYLMDKAVRTMVSLELPQPPSAVRLPANWREACAMVDVSIRL